MKRKIIVAATAIAIVAGMLVVLATPAVAQVQEVCDQLRGQDIAGCDPSNLETTVGRITNTLIFIVGAISVIVLIIAGLMYVLSTGNPEQTKRAKDAIIYAAIGLAVSVLSFAIVNFVLDRLRGG